MARTFTVSRTTTISAPPERILPLITDLKAWQRWSPWEGMDPDLVRTYGGPDSGVGATYAWKGNRQAGAGRMEIVEASPTSVGVDLQFTAPMRAHNRVDLTLSPSDYGTLVKWQMTGPMNVVMSLMSRFWSMEKMIGPDFEKGLRQLKTVAEAG